MTKCFFDCDVIIDFLLSREPFFDDIRAIFKELTNKEILICISPLTVANSYYIIRVNESKKIAKEKIELLLKLVNVEHLYSTAIIKSKQSNFRDFEDAIQNFCAEEANHRVILTRNTKDFIKSRLTILNPKQLLQLLSN